MYEQAEHISYKQVTKALALGWAWFKLRPKGIDGGRPLMIRPVSVGERVYDSQYRRYKFTFKAVDEDGAVYDIAVRDESDGHVHNGQAPWMGDNLFALTEYAVTSRPVPIPRVRTV